MRIERIQLVESGYFQHSAERLERERKKTHTDQAISFEDKRSDNNQYEHEEKEHLADHEATAHDEQGDDFDKSAQEQLGITRVNVVV